MELPTRASWEQMQADPSLPERNASLLAEFESAPWLLPPHTPALPYAGVHELHALLQLRATSQGRYNKTVALLTFNQKFARLAQNTIYSMVKLGGVRNYVVGTWSAPDLVACTAMNLPCADLSPWLPEPMNGDSTSDQYMSHDYLVIGWMRPAVIKHLLQLGYVVYLTDSDVAFVNKPVWDSFLAFVEEVGADAAFQAEQHIVNIGSYVVLPTPATIRLYDAWAGSAVAAIRDKKQDQFFLPKLSHLFDLCNTRHSCLERRKAQAEASEGSQPAAATAEPGAPREGGSGTEPQVAADAEGGRNAPQAVAAANKEVRGTEPQAAVNDKESSVAEPQAAAGADPPQAAAGGGPKALFRTFPPSFWMYAPDVCALVHPEHLPVMDTCDWNVLFFHPVCDDRYSNKTALFKQQGVWFMDEDSCTANTSWAACQPLRWRQPDVEQHLYSCTQYSLALVHERPQRKP